MTQPPFADLWGDIDRPPPESVTVRGVEVRKGSRVRLNPRAGGDVMDAALAGRIAIVEAIDQRVEGALHLAVILEDDPGRDMGSRRFPGHRFFFTAEEVEPLEDGSPAPTRKVLVAGIGNIFLGDDGFGVALARRMAERSARPGITITDFGIRGLDLAYAMQDDYDLVILLDAVPRGGEPGTLYVIEPDVDPVSDVVPDAHGMDPVKVLALARSLGRIPARTLVVGCEPGSLDVSRPSPDSFVQLSPAVAAALDGAAELVESLWP